MVVFGNNAFVNAAATKDYSTVMNLTRQGHMVHPDSPYSGSGNNILNLRDTISTNRNVGVGNFEDAMLQALDKVSGAQLRASDLQKEAIINPGSVDIHDITIAQAEANMALGITRNVLSRIVQGWRDLINTR